MLCIFWTLKRLKLSNSSKNQKNVSRWQLVMEQTMFQWSKQRILELVYPVLRGLRLSLLLIFLSLRNHSKQTTVVMNRQSAVPLDIVFSFFEWQKVSISWTIVIHSWPIFVLSNEHFLGLFPVEEFLIYFLTILVWYLLHVFCNKSLRWYDDCSFQCCLYRFTSHCSCLIWQGEVLPFGLGTELTSLLINI